MNPNQKNIKAQAVERIKDASNVLVTVSANPSVDQLSAAIGLTLLLNKLGKHGTAVFSGDVPSTLKFLQPEKTLEKNTDSLRDFIISLDKSKADKLRYKVEEKVVKIFITPYRTSLSQNDLEFSQGDFNVDAVIALGVQQREDLDQAVISQARILHDAAIISVNNTVESTLGSINWYDNAASSLCEMLVTLGELLKSDFLDPQMATAFLTGIVAETERFSNDKTTPRAMTVAGRLMTAGANQQLIATKLEEEPEPAPEPQAAPENFDDAKLDELAQDNAPAEPEDEPAENADGTDGTLQIGHDTDGSSVGFPGEGDEAEEPEDEEPQDQIRIDSEGKVRSIEELELEKAAEAAAPAKSVNAQQDNTTDPPILDHADAPDIQPEPSQSDEPASEPLTLPPVDDGDLPTIEKDNDKHFLGDEGGQETSEQAVSEPEAEPSQSLQPAAPTVADIEEQVKAAEAPEQDAPPAVTPKASPVPDETQARDEVNDAITAAPPDPDRFGPRKDIGAINPDLDLGHASPGVVPPQSPPAGPQIDPNNPPVSTFPPNLVPPEPVATQDRTAGSPSPSAPPPVPPPMPMMPPPPVGNQGQDDNSLPSANNPFTLPPQQ